MSQFNIDIKHKDDAIEYRKRYSKQYYHQYKDVVKQKRNEPMKCSKCGKIVTKQAIWAHKRSKKCLQSQCDDESYRKPVFKPKETIETF